MATSILVADDHGIVRDGIQLLLETLGNCTIVGSAADGLEAITLLAELRPEIAIVDLLMPGLDGIEVTKRVQALGLPTRVIVLSIVHELESVRAALAAGGYGYVLKESASSELLAAVAAVQSGHRYLSPVLRQELLDEVGTKSASQRAERAIDLLSPREREILPLLISGHTSAEIGDQLGLATSTVDTYRSRLKQKLGISSAVDLVRFGIQQGIITPR